MDRHALDDGDVESARHEKVGNSDAAYVDRGLTPTTSEQLGLGPSGPPSMSERVEALMDGLDKWRDRPLVVGALLLVAALVALVSSQLVDREVEGPPVEERIPLVTLAPTTAAQRSETVVVHVSGAVRSPGVYTLDATARIIDAVDIAGGPTGEAELHQLNLAALVADGQQIRVPVAGESVTPVEPATTGPIDLNRADVIVLQELPGVGPATAAAIVAHREEHGPFRTVDDLLDVPGIGPAKLAAIADAAIVR